MRVVFFVSLKRWWLFIEIMFIFFVDVIFVCL